MDEIWSKCRSRYGESGDWLFGEFTLADIMFVPVALRFLTYGISVSDSAKQFQRAVCDREAVREWIAAATGEPEAIEFIDELMPASKSPLTLG